MAIHRARAYVSCTYLQIFCFFFLTRFLFPLLFFLRLAAPLWPLLDTWLAEAKDTNNSTMLKNLLGVLIMLPVSFALLVGGRQIPKVVRKLAKKWPKEDVREMAAGLFKRYTAIIAENTDGEVGTVVSKSQPTSPRSDSDRKFVNSFNDEAVVEEWENEWKIYKAIDDETPSQIAKKKNVSLNDLLKINVWRLEGLKAGSPLEAGTDILVPINGPNDPKKKAKKRVRAASASEEASSRANLKRVRSSSESTATPAASRRPVATSPPARTPSVAVVKSPTALPSQKKVAKQAVPQIRKLSSSGRSGSFGAALGMLIYYIYIHLRLCCVPLFLIPPASSSSPFLLFFHFPSLLTNRPFFSFSFFSFSFSFSFFLFFPPLLSLSLPLSLFLPTIYIHWSCFFAFFSES